MTRGVSNIILIPNTGYASHSEGVDTIALGWGSHASGWGTRAVYDGSNVRGWFNEIDWETPYLDVVGNGTDENNRSNAYTLDINGNAWFAGGIMSDIGVEVPFVAADTIGAGELTSETINSNSITASTATINSLNASNGAFMSLNTAGGITALSVSATDIATDRLRIKGDDGNTYYLTIDTQGNLKVKMV